MTQSVKDEAKFLDTRLDDETAAPEADRFRGGVFRYR